MQETHFYPNYLFYIQYERLSNTFPGLFSLGENQPFFNRPRLSWPKFKYGEIDFMPVMQSNALMQN
jgi:hypothetical protein